MTQTIESVKKMSQTDLILDYLLNGGKLTALEALDKFGCFRLGARIWDIRNMGYIVDKQTIVTPGGARIAIYSIKEENRCLTA